MRTTMLTPGESSEPVFGDKATGRLTNTQYELLQTFSRSVLAAPTYPDVFRVLADFTRGIGAGAVNCAVFDNVRLELLGVSSTMTPAAIERYFSENMAADDPLIPRIQTDPRPALLGWGFGVTPVWEQGNSARMLAAMEKDGYHGLAYFPVLVAGNPYSTSITIRCELEPEKGQAFLDSEFALLQLAADIVGHRAAALFQGRTTGEYWYAFSQPILSPREREILRWLASGLRTDQIAHQLDLKPVTVHMHLRSARNKLGARTREHLIALAALRGLL